MKAGKKGGQVIFHNSPVFLLPLFNALSFWHRDIPYGFF